MGQIDVLNLLKEEKKPMTAMEISERLNCPRQRVLTYLRKLHRKWGLVDFIWIEKDKKKMKLWRLNES